MSTEIKTKEERMDFLFQSKGSAMMIDGALRADQDR